ncbi:MAG: SoxR reducing system RseC family protein [Gammaproteobacteria bacterium]|nr:SoxR reducing system RseC family protein [Gammaproteobacteria bacterium]
MIEEQALVIALQGDQVIIQIQRQNACQSCELSGGCGTGSLGRLLGYRQRDLLLQNDHNLVVGDKVVIGLPEKYFIYAGLLMYLFPLLCLFIFAVLSDFVFDATQWINVVSSLFGLVLGLLFSAKLANKTFASQLQPRYIRRELPIEMGSVKLNQADSVYP